MVCQTSKRNLKHREPAKPLWSSILGLNTLGICCRTDASLVEELREWTGREHFLIRLLPSPALKLVRSATGPVFFKMITNTANNKSLPLMTGKYCFVLFYLNDHTRYPSYTFGKCLRSKVWGEQTRQNGNASVWCLWKATKHQNNKNNIRCQT